MLNIAIDCRMVRHSGIGTYIRNIVPRVIESLRSRQIQFHLIGNPASLAEDGLDREGVNLIEDSSGIYSLQEQVSLLLKLPKSLDLLWVPHYNIPILFRGRLLVTVHDACHLAVEQYSKNVFRRWYSKGLYGAIRRKATAVITVSQFSAREIVKYSKISPEHIVCIHNGVDESWRVVKTAAVVKEGSPYFVFVGNLKPHKNLARLISAFSHLTGVLPHNLVLVGRSEGFIVGDEISKQLAVKLGSRVQFTGHIGEFELRQLLANADGLVFPSLYEGFGLPALEAMAAGCPVIASRTTSLPEVCGNAALYVDPLDEHDIAEKMRRLGTSKELGEELRAKGYARVRQFSWQSAVSKTIEVLDRVLIEKASTASQSIQIN